MKNRIVSIILLAIVCMTLLLPYTNVYAENVQPLELNKTVTGNFSEGIYPLFSFEAKEDGLYKTVLKDGGGQRNVLGNTALLYDKTSSQQIPMFENMCITDGFNVAEQMYVSEWSYYLHKGTYNISLYHEIPCSYSFRVEKLKTEYGEDKETNDSASAAIPFEIGKAGGWLGGFRDDGSQDVEDWYVINIPEAMSSRLSLVLDRKDNNPNGELTVYDEAGEALAVGSAERNALDGLYKLEMDTTFPKGGKYYLRVYAFSTPVQYLLTGDTGKSVTPPNNPTVTSDTTAAGIVLRLPELTTGIGWRIWRSEASGVKGDIIAELVTGKAFVDANIEAGKTYYYTIAEVMNDGTTSENSATVTATASKDLASSDIAGKKGFILMKINSPTMSVNGEQHEIDPGRGTTPIIQNGRTLVPIRAIIETIGGTVGWDELERKISLSAQGHTVEMWVEQRGIISDGQRQEIDVPPTIINGRTLLPIRFVAENVGCVIEWIGSTQEVVIVYAL